MPSAVAVDVLVQAHHQPLKQKLTWSILTPEVGLNEKFATRLRVSPSAGRASVPGLTVTTSQCSDAASVFPAESVAEIFTV